MAYGKASHTEGYWTVTGTQEGNIGKYAHAEGEMTEAYGTGAHAEGSQTISSNMGSHAEGGLTVASGVYAHAEGHETSAVGYSAHAEGEYSSASSEYSHAEGFQTGASGTAAHAEGYSTQTNNDYSHAEGYWTIASGQAQHVEGKLNIEDTENKYIHIAGNGTDENYTEDRSNAYTLDWNGNGWFAGNISAEGKVYVGEGENKQALSFIGQEFQEDKMNQYNYENQYGEIFNDYNYNIATGQYSHAEGYQTRATQLYAHAEGTNSFATGKASHAENASAASGEYAHSEGNGEARGNYSHSEGMSTISQGDTAHAEGNSTKALGASSHAEGYQTKTGALNNNSYVSGTGIYSHAEGYSTTADGTAAHTEGYGTFASQIATHAEGYGTQAKNLYAHSEGYYTAAEGIISHAEGSNTVAHGNFSHAEGSNTYANGENSHVQGKNNIIDTENKYAHIIGNGNSANARNNAHTVDWNGNAWFSGKVSVGGTNFEEGEQLLTQQDLQNYQSKLTFDTEPIEGSNNPVTSNGIYQAISNISTGGGGGGSENTPSKTLGFNEIVPVGSLPSICDFEFKPTTPLCIYNLQDNNVLYNGQLFGEEIPLLTTRGNLTVIDSDNNIKFEKYIDSMINIVNTTYNWDVSDTLTQDGLHKAWSKKFYLTMDEYIERTDSGNNSIYTFEFDESDFAETGIPAKLDNIPIATPCFYPGTSNGTVYGGDPFKLKFSYNQDTGKYIMTIRGFGINLIFYQLQYYSKTYIYYQLETPYIEKDFLAMGLEEGDKILFENDYSYMQKYLNVNKFLKNGTDSGNLVTNLDAPPTIAVLVPQNTIDALNGFSNAAKIFNEGQSSDNDVAQDYSWIGDGDSTTDYTMVIQNKIKELRTVSNGGTIFLGNGVYPISNFIELTDNIKLIGTENTVIQQTNKNEHVLVVSGSNITIRDIKLKLYAMSAEEKQDPSKYNPNLTACVFINSNNTGEYYNEKYSENIYCKNLTMDNVYLFGSYGFTYTNGYPEISNDYEYYRGCGLIQEKLFFNYANITNVHISGMYHGIDGLGGSNNFIVYCESCKTMVYGPGGYANLTIFGHSYYGTDINDNTISMSDEIGHFTTLEQSYITEYVYDTQWLKNIFVFEGYTMNNRYIISQIGGASYITNNQNRDTIKLKHNVVDYGRGNRAIENFQNTPYHIGSKYKDKTNQSSFKLNDPITQNALSGAGIWGNITSNDTFDGGAILLHETCRYPTTSNVDKHIGNSGLLFALSNNTPTEENPIEIVIDVSNRPICSLSGGFIQFDSAYIASDFEMSFDITNSNDFTDTITVTDNIDTVWYYIPHQSYFKTIYKIKIVITKALYIESLKYQSSAYDDYEIEYNPNKKIGICNIGMIDADFAGRAFLGECGGDVYGDLTLNNNSTIKNVPLPINKNDAVSKAYVDSQLSVALLPTVLTSISDKTIILQDRQIVRLGEYDTLTLLMPEEDLSETYYSEFSFISGEIATNLIYTDTPIIWAGDDVDADGVFIPESNTFYEVSIKKLGEAGIYARVGGTTL